jgi:hypothetical protein
MFADPAVAARMISFFFFSRLQFHFFPNGLSACSSLAKQNCLYALRCLLSCVKSLLVATAVIVLLRKSTAAIPGGETLR